MKTFNVMFRCDYGEMEVPDDLLKQVAHVPLRKDGGLDQRFAATKWLNREMLGRVKTAYEAGL